MRSFARSIVRAVPMLRCQRSSDACVPPSRPVDSASTLLLMRNFYRYLLPAGDASAASRLHCSGQNTCVRRLPSHVLSGVCRKLVAITFVVSLFGEPVIDRDEEIP